MFARNVTLRLKPNHLNQFGEIFESHIIPLLRRQSGFEDVITFAMTGGTEVLVVSLWRTKEAAEAYRTEGYPLALQRLEHILDGSPKLRMADIVHSTFHQVAMGMAC